MNTKNKLTRAEFLAILYENWKPALETEMISIDKAFGYILAEDIDALYNLPVVRASAFDGVAIKSERFVDGFPDTSEWKKDIDFIRADTGDDFSDGFDAVLMIEWVDIHEEKGITINIPDGIKIEKGLNVRPSGSSIRAGERLADKGRKLTPLLLASIANGGHSEVKVFKKPRVGYIPTGSELIPIGQIPKRGENISSNAILIRGMLKEMNAEPVIFPIVPDDMSIIEETVIQALKECDILLLSGGSSKGSEDYTFRVLENCGTLLAHEVRSAPGRPMSVAVVNGKPVINLSGPPIAALNGMQWCVREVIGHFYGQASMKFHELDAVLTEDMSCPGVMEFLKMINVSQLPDGSFTATPVKSDDFIGRPRISDSLSANAMYNTKLGETELKTGDIIRVSLVVSSEEL